MTDDQMFYSGYGVIYLDMDGVLANFFDKFAEKFGKPHWKEIPNKEQSIAELKNTDFFFQLDPFSTTISTVDLVKDVAKAHNLNWGINSSPLRGDRDNSAYWKRLWLEKYNIMPDVQHLIFTGMKEKWAVNEMDGTPNILIDDKPTNIQKWEAKGGLGIRWQANRDSFDDLTEQLWAAAATVNRTYI